MDFGLTFEEAKEMILDYSHREDEYFKDERENLIDEYYIAEDGCTFEYQNLGKVSYDDLDEALKFYTKKDHNDSGFLNQLLCNFVPIDPVNLMSEKFKRFLEAKTFIQSSDDPNDLDGAYYLFDNNC